MLLHLYNEIFYINKMREIKKERNCPPASNYPSMKEQQEELELSAKTAGRDLRTLPD